ncbi:hypothetical protein [Enterococcus sp. DIV0876]|uniref:hypothetical protein n=1 Tax=Enterococcus sp. DIV0876 TaxID=2774633 RepID=UPI003D300153
MKKIIGISSILFAVLAIAIPVSAEETQARQDEPGTANREIPVNGAIYHNDTDYNITVPASVSWFVTEEGQTGPNVFEVWNRPVGGNVANPNRIVNQSSLAQYHVTMTEFNQVSSSDAAIVAPDLELFLTGALSLGNQNLSEGYVNTNPYPALFDAEDEWYFGFSGEYTTNLTTTELSPRYTMKLHFDLL